MHSLAVYTKEALLFARDLPLENFSRFSLNFRLALLHSVSYFFFLYRLTYLSLWTVFAAISFNTDEVLSINPFANVFVFGDINISHKDWQNFSGGLGRPGEVCYNFCISNKLTFLVDLIDVVKSAIMFLSQTNLLRWLIFLLGSLAVTLTVLLF